MPLLERDGLSCGMCLRWKERGVVGLKRHCKCGGSDGVRLKCDFQSCQELHARISGG